MGNTRSWAVEFILGRIDEEGFVASGNVPPTEQDALASNVQPMETIMEKILRIFGALLISGMAVQMAAASEHGHLTKANLSRHHSDFRGAYNQVSGPINVSVTPSALYRTDTDFRRADPSWIGDEDPSLHPSD
jgi:hypothetical protein